MKKKLEKAIYLHFLPHRVRKVIAALFIVVGYAGWLARGIQLAVYEHNPDGWGYLFALFAATLVFIVLAVKRNKNEKKESIIKV